MSMEIIIFIILIIWFLVYIASWWVLFEKAGQKGWYVLIPLVNIIIFLKIAKVPL